MGVRTYSLVVVLALAMAQGCSVSKAESAPVLKLEALEVPDWPGSRVRTLCADLEEWQDEWDRELRLRLEAADKIRKQVKGTGKFFTAWNHYDMVVGRTAEDYVDLRHDLKTWSQDTKSLVATTSFLQELERARRNAIEEQSLEEDMQSEGVRLVPANGRMIWSLRFALERKVDQVWAYALALSEETELQAGAARAIRSIEARED